MTSPQGKVSKGSRVHEDAPSAVELAVDKIAFV